MGRFGGENRKALSGGEIYIWSWRERAQFGHGGRKAMLDQVKI
jgi:hypothetical protein